MRNLSRIAVVAALACAPSALLAQRQGAVEIGGFGRFTKFADTLGIDAAFGGGGRAGIYVLRNVMLEMDLSYAEPKVTNPVFAGPPINHELDKVSHALWSYRLLWNAPMGNRLRLMLGGGYAYNSYGMVRNVAPRGGGPEGLVGLRALINDRVSLRFAATGNYVPSEEGTIPVPRPSHFNVGANAGLSVGFFLNPPKPRIQYDTVRVTMRDTIYVNRIDTVRIPAVTNTNTGVTTPGRPIVIGAINFAFNKSDITPEAKTILDRIAESLTDPANSSRTIAVTGNTDAIGSERYNMKLGQDRADQAKAYLVSKGVAESRITARTQGESDPIAPNTTDNGRATNRRVLIMLTN